MTPAATRKIAASTNETAPNALIESLTKVFEPAMTTFFSYQGRNIAASSPIAATAAKRWSRSSAAYAVRRRCGRVLTWRGLYARDRASNVDRPR